MYRHFVTERKMSKKDYFILKAKKTFIILKNADIKHNTNVEISIIFEYTLIFLNYLCEIEINISLGIVTNIEKNFLPKGQFSRQ